MSNHPQGIRKKLQQRKANHSFRTLSYSAEGVDFFSNDYLGFSKNDQIYQQSLAFLALHQLQQNNATGSRLLSGNLKIHINTEAQIAKFHEAESAILFNSGYDANLGFFSSVPQRGDVVFYDEFIHASIRDGLQLSLAKSYKFKHNDLRDLKNKAEKINASGAVFVVTESVFSMDGDSPNLKSFLEFCDQKQFFLIVDEAHALGVFGENGEGLLQQQNLHHQVFARIVTFGKGLGAHGAVVLGSLELKDFIVNFTRSFIYTTANSPHAVATISSAYQELLSTSAIKKLHQNIDFFKQQLKELKLESNFIQSNSAIQCSVISGNDRVKQIANTLQEQHFLVKPILSPTVKKGQERLRFCLHSYNTSAEITSVLQCLKNELL
ncbi:aminotransferase class I/II-fold pyridoxal phosphate-dependent enzyme [Mesonia aestuariivivens]|uniref:Pyridoxal phosphate-dependent aminotransferase family protein n=1 Tax=Mesonia aestuariivivens TaxID=2796128 RepID=A0ABS6VXP0_9FLAO|nr:pyridoxal phosphate-dependent aminotransferase family protein [Mesonia aestuariivivens]